MINEQTRDLKNKEEKPQIKNTKKPTVVFTEKYFLLA
jgi:hypothetical protein